MSEKSDQKIRSRRSFVGHTILGSAGVALGLIAGNYIRSNNQEVVKMMTPGGELVEVPKNRLKPTSKKKVSIQELKKWMAADHKNKNEHSL